MSCNICSSSIERIFTALVLGEHDVEYFRCNTCGFIQTEEPYWLEEAYKDPVSIYDTGMVYRGMLWSSILKRIISKLFDRKAKYLDYGGGTGLLVRMMRDSGYDFYRYDPYGTNIFARGFDASDLEEFGKFELLTAFEVFEHVEKPLESIEEMFGFSETIIFSTLLQPLDSRLLNPEEWTYFAPQTGQHISFYTKRSLESIASTFSCNLYSDEEDVHILTKRELKLSKNKMKGLVIPRRMDRWLEMWRNRGVGWEKMPSHTVLDYEKMLSRYPVPLTKEREQEGVRNASC